jgi:GntR family transcriptional regulator, transcriptional repressor for pyruvate dehydrogenase complex
MDDLATDSDSITDTVSRQIAGYINHHSLQAGDKLPSERNMTEMFGVSRVSLREAIRGLVVINLLEVRNGKGVFVKNPKATLFGANLQMKIRKEQLIQLIEVRKALELHVLRGLFSDPASSSPEEEDLKEIDAILLEMEYPHVPDQKVANLDAAFHTRINQLSGNQVLVDLMENTIILSNQLWEESGRNVHQAIRRSIPLHRSLFEALKSGDTESAISIYEKIVELDTAFIQDSSSKDDT